MYCMDTNIYLLLNNTLKGSFQHYSKLVVSYTTNILINIY